MAVKLSWNSAPRPNVQIVVAGICKPCRRTGRQPAAAVGACQLTDHVGEWDRGGSMTFEQHDWNSIPGWNEHSIPHSTERIHNKTTYTGRKA